MKIAASYIRVSTNDQLEFSPDAQLRAMKKYCNDNDLLLPNEFIFIDEGISGRNAKKRPAFQIMIKTAKSNLSRLMSFLYINLTVSLVTVQTV